MKISRSAEVIPFPDTKRNFAIIKAVKEAVELKMSYLFEGLIINAGDALFEEMWCEDKAEILRRQFNVVRYLNEHAKYYEPRLYQDIDCLWEQLPTGEQMEMPAGPVAELITLNSQKLQNHYKILINEIRQRFKYLLGRDVVHFPLSPENFYISFWQTMDDSGLSYQERYTLEVLFHRFVMDRYGQVLAAANGTLIDLRVDVRTA